MDIKEILNSRLFQVAAVIIVVLGIIGVILALRGGEQREEPQFALNPTQTAVPPDSSNVTPIPTTSRIPSQTAGATPLPSARLATLTQWDKETPWVYVDPGKSVTLGGVTATSVLDGWYGSLILSTTNGSITVFYRNPNRHLTTGAYTIATESVPGGQYNSVVVTWGGGTCNVTRVITPIEAPQWGWAVQHCKAN